MATWGRDFELADFGGLNPYTSQDLLRQRIQLMPAILCGARLLERGSKQPIKGGNDLRAELFTLLGHRTPCLHLCRERAVHGLALVNTTGTPVGIRLAPACGVHPGYPLNHSLPGKLLTHSLDPVHVGHGVLWLVEVKSLCTEKELDIQVRLYQRPA